MLTIAETNKSLVLAAAAMDCLPHQDCSCTGQNEVYAFSIEDNARRLNSFSKTVCKKSRTSLELGDQRKIQSFVVASLRRKKQPSGYFPF
jgi:hypothetical protein